MTVDTGSFEKSNKILDQAKISDASTPAPSPTGSKSGKSDNEKLKLRRRRTEKKLDAPNKKGRNEFSVTYATKSLAING